MQTEDTLKTGSIILPEIIKSPPFALFDNQYI